MRSLGHLFTALTGLLCGARALVPPPASFSLGYEYHTIVQTAAPVLFGGTDGDHSDAGPDTGGYAVPVPLPNAGVGPNVATARPQIQAVHVIVQESDIIGSRPHSWC